MNYRVKIFGFLLLALSILFLLGTAFSALQTLSRLDAVEANRDTWQRPSEVTDALDLKPGDVVVDLGCGSGYFTLKLSSPVGRDGRVIAEDIRRLPLAFLWFRAASQGDHNVRVVLGSPTDPHLPPRVSAVLISNTYHEFSDSHSILVHVYQALVPAGRLVVVDREPHQNSAGSEIAADHEISADQVQEELQQANFRIVRRQDRLVENDPYGENWWLIAARKP